MNKKRSLRNLFHPAAPRILSEMLETRRLLTAVSFAPHVDIPVGTGTTPVAIAAADFTNNGDEDLAVADSTTDKVYVFFGNGAGSFSAGPVLSLSSPASEMIVGDFNGDGLPDIAVACDPGTGQNTTTVDVFLNTGGGTFGLGQITTVETDAVAGEPVPIAAGDFNGSGHLDLAVGDYTDSNVSILMGTGTGTFAAPVTYNLIGEPTAIAAADINNDGNPDLAVTTTLTNNTTGVTLTTNELSVLYGSATGDFSAGPTIVLNSAGIPYSVASADLTGSTYPGLIVGSSDAAATVFTNTAGALSESAQATLAAGSTQIAVADFNLDGNLDFVSSDGGSATSTTTNSVTVVQGTGSGNIGTTTSFNTGAEPADVVVADFNNDGKPDIATANAKGGTVSILLNNTALPLVSTKTALTLSSASTPAGTAVTMTATITPSSASPLTNEEVPTGSVNFYDGTTLLSTVTLTASSTQAVFSTTALPIGTDKLKAVYSGDDAYATSTTAIASETITPTATEGPDLVGTFVSSTLPAIVAPGETGNVIIRVTNQGNSIASGAITNTVYLSLDTLLDSGDTAVTVKGSLAKTNVHLKAGQSVLLTGTITIPQSTALANYYLLTLLNTTNSLAESVSTNNLVVSPTTYQVADVFGTVDGRKNVVLTATDENGTSATFKLTGAGNGTLNIGDDGVDLILDQTTAASSLTVTTRGTFDIAELTADSAAGKLTMPGVDISNTISLTDGLTSLTLGTFGAAGVLGDTISIGGDIASTISINSVPAADLAATAGIKSLSVGSWGTGEVTAPYITTLKSKQSFTPGLILSGAGAPGGIALNTATISGTVGSTSSNWNIGGGISHLSAAAFTTGWILNDTGTLKSIASSGAFSITIDATSIGTIQAAGAVTGGTFDSSTSIQAITIKGPVDSTTQFLAETFPRKAILGGAAVDPLTDPRFKTI
jgi:hypothetical protein